MLIFGGAYFWNFTVFQSKGGGDYSREVVNQGMAVI